MLTAADIHKNYGQLEVLRGVSLTIKQGEIVSIVGPSGSGKSTLLHILGTLDRAGSGQISLDNKNLGDLKAKALAAFRNRNIGFVFQFHHLLPEFTALENVCVPGWIAGRGKKEVAEKAASLLSLLGLKERIENKPQQLSGGEQQRV
ncbi:MAG TPA: ATP-binding cassette domain-containing protein, partial [Chitinophagaceae bacterium]|nr:ATP-binding cassette domain-containing protein [Chitinophagaceae bacterium]